MIHSTDLCGLNLISLCTERDKEVKSHEEWVQSIFPICMINSTNKSSRFSSFIKFAEINV